LHARTAAPSAPKLAPTAVISVRTTRAAANKAVTGSREVTGTATRAAPTEAEIMTTASREAGSRARAPSRSSSLVILKPTSIPSSICSRL
jgi:hypothetical protein